jgi:hypothetical protein
VLHIDGARTMNERNTRRAILALMNAECFRYVADQDGGKPEEEGLTFTVAEINQAKSDRARISDHYGELKQKKSFWESETIARMQFLSDMEELS